MPLRSLVQTAPERLSDFLQAADDRYEDAETLAIGLRSHVVNGLHPEWIVDMRYRRSNLAAADAWAALNNSWWVKMNWLTLT
jgi:hypothetical protein